MTSSAVNTSSSSSSSSSNKFLPNDHALPATSPLVHKVKELISQAWGMPHVIHHNPSPNPVSLEKKYLSHLESHITEYVIAEKSDGIRYLLVLGVFQGQGFSVMVNRKMQMFEVAVCARSDYFQGGSVFDGEMVIETTPSRQERQLFLIFDTISVKGESQRMEHLMKRFNEYLKIFDTEGKDILDVDSAKWDALALEMAESQDKIVCLGNGMALQFSPKPFVQLLNVGSMWRTLPTLKHKSDGLILTRTTSPIGTGTDVNILKWKEHHTIDLIVKAHYAKGRWHYKLFFQDGDQLVESTERTFSIAQKTDKPSDSQRLYYLQLKLNSILTLTSQYYAETHKTSFSLLAECACEFDPTQPIVWCTVIKWRRDKQTPNNATVVQYTLNNIADNVTIDELIHLATKTMYKF